MAIAVFRLSAHIDRGRNIRSGIFLNALTKEENFDRLRAGAPGAGHPRGCSAWGCGVCIFGVRGFGSIMTAGLADCALGACRTRSSFGIRTPSNIVAIPFFSPGLNFFITHLTTRCRLPADYSIRAMFQAGESQNEEILPPHHLPHYYNIIKVSEDVK